MIRHGFRDGLNLIPRHMRDGVVNYVQHGRETGGFLTALLSGDETAWNRADPTNLGHKAEWLEYIAGWLPPDCHGSPLKVAAWQKMGGLDGYPLGGE